MPKRAIFGLIFLLQLLVALAANARAGEPPNRHVLERLAQSFDEAKMPLSTGDLHLETRWQCTELFTDRGGYSTFRYTSLSFSLADKGILEEVLHKNPRYYAFTRTALVSDDAEAEGVTHELRVDYQGNLRLVSRDGAGQARSYTVCLAAHRIER